MDTEEIKELVESRAWSEDNARVSVRAEHKCEYCGLDFFASVSNYCLWQKDHIVPIKHGGTDEMSNYAAACFPCNVVFKAQWNPKNHTGSDASREQLVAVTRDYIAGKRLQAELLLESQRKMVRWNR